jgi:hypothetical protein
MSLARWIPALFAWGACVLAVGPLAAQTTWYVNPLGTPPGNGTPATPYTSIQYAIAQPTTVDGDTLQVFPSTYRENLDFLGKALELLGVVSAVIDGGGNGPCVKFVNGEGPSSVLNGFTLINGMGEAVPVGGDGGAGVLCIGSSPRIEHCTITTNGSSANCSPQYGGGMYLLDSSPQVTQTAIGGNFACSEGAGVVLFGTSAPVFTDCSIGGNFTAAFPSAPQGAGVSSYAVAPAPPLFDGCSFVGNQGGRGPALSGRAHAVGCHFASNRGTLTGGAVYNVTLLESCVLDGNELFCDGTGAALEGAGAAEGSTLIDCVITGNRGIQGGGVRNCIVSGSVISNNESVFPGCSSFAMAGGGGAANSTLTDCAVVANQVEQGFGSPNDTQGGGILGGSATRCFIADNLADVGGGAAQVVLESCTLIDNVARVTAGAGQDVTVHNSILWGNSSPVLDAGSPASYCDVQGGLPGVGNIDALPGFWAPVSGSDYHLLPTSPCIDVGDPASPLDPDGSRADMGAFAFDATHVGQPAIYCTTKPSSLGCLASIGFSGTPTLSGPDDFHVTADGVQGQVLGLLLWGRAPAATPFFGGTLCIAPPFFRTAGQDSGAPSPSCRGGFDFHFDHALMAFPGTDPFDSIYAQYWHRDVGSPQGAGVTNALEFVVQP